MKKILFVCHGNVGRSQIAETYYNYFTHSKNASSAGTDPTTPARYACPNKEVVEVMKEEGIDVSQNKVKTITKERVDKSDNIFVLCDKELCPDFLLNSKKDVFWEIEDSYKKSIEETRRIRDSIKSKILSII